MAVVDSETVLIFLKAHPNRKVRSHLDVISKTMFMQFRQFTLNFVGIRVSETAEMLFKPWLLWTAIKALCIPSFHPMQQCVKQSCCGLLSRRCGVGDHALALFRLAVSSATTATTSTPPAHRQPHMGADDDARSPPARDTYPAHPQLLKFTGNILLARLLRQLQICSTIATAVGGC